MKPIVYPKLEVDILMKFRTRAAFAVALGRPESWLSPRITGAVPIEDKDQLIMRQVLNNDDPQLFEKVADND